MREFRRDPCVAATVRPRLEGARGTKRTVSRGNGDFLLAPFLVVDISGGTASTATFCQMIQDEIRERELRGKHRRKGSVFAYRNKNHPTDVDTGNCRTGVGTIHVTANGRLAHASFGLPTLNRFESISGESSPGVDAVSVMRSPLEPDDGSGRHSNESGTADGTASVESTMP